MAYTVPVPYRILPVTAFSIVLLAMIAAFLGMRLYSVLGKRTGHEQEPVLPRRDERAAPSPLPGRIDDGEAPAALPAAGASGAGLVYEPAAEAGLRQLLAADRDTLRDLCDDDSYEGFVEAIEARDARGEKLENRLIGVDSAKITAVEVNRSEARITVRYQADISAVTRDADGKMIAGSMSDATQANDLWTFRRQVGSSDPNWLLDEVEAA
jgi:predicted lipid-binding transport protein (Tim44 family)